MADIKTNQLDALHQLLTPSINCAAAHFDAQSAQKHHDEFCSLLSTVTITGTIIDHAFTSILCPPDAFIIRADITGHYPTALRFNSTKSSPDI